MLSGQGRSEGTSLAALDPTQQDEATFSEGLAFKAEGLACEVQGSACEAACLEPETCKPAPTFPTASTFLSYNLQGWRYFFKIFKEIKKNFQKA